MSIFRPRTTWDIVWGDFKDRFPNMAKHVVKHKPYGFATICIWFDDGTRWTYNDETKCLKRRD